MTDYNRTQPAGCVECEASNTEQVGLEIGPSTVEEELRCLECHTEWAIVYKIESITVLQKQGGIDP